MRLRRLIELAVLVLIVMATVGVGSTYDARSGVARWLLFCLSALAFLFIHQGGRRARRYAVQGLALVGVAVASGTLFLKATLALLAGVGLSVPQRFTGIATRFEVEFPPGLIVLMLPFLISEWWIASRKPTRQTGRFWLVGILLACGAIVISGSLATMMVLALVSALIAVRVLVPRVAARTRWNRWTAMGAGLAGLGAIATSILLFMDQSIPDIFPWGAIAGRLDLVAQSARLVGDYAIVGGGLGSIPGLYAHYIRGLPVYFVPHSQNLYLNVAIELGLAGLTAFLVLIVASALSLFRSWKLTSRRRGWSKYMAVASLVSLLGVIFLGLIDDPFYASSGLPLMIVIPGVAVSLERDRPDTEVAFPRLPAAVGAFVILSVAIFNRHTLAATWLANLAAIDMAKVELRGWPSGKWSRGDRLHRLSESERQFLAARQYDPTERTALHRLGLIAMERRDYGRAVDLLSEAHRLDPGHRGIRKALGYSMVWIGEYSSAYEMLREIPEVEGELKRYEGWWQAENRPDLAQYSSEMLIFLVQSER